jgi:hypothetical protein
MVENEYEVGRLAVLTSDIDGLPKGTWVRIEKVDGGVVTVSAASGTDERRYTAFRCQMDPAIPACEA